MQRELLHEKEKNFSKEENFSERFPWKVLTAEAGFFFTYFKAFGEVPGDNCSRVPSSKVWRKYSVTFQKWTSLYRHFLFFFSKIFGQILRGPTVEFFFKKSANSSISNCSRNEPSFPENVLNAKKRISFVLFKRFWRSTERWLH